MVLGARGPRLRIEVTLRFDLPNPPGTRVAAGIAAHAVAVLAAQQFTTVIAIGYGPGPLVTPLADAIRQATAGTDLKLRDVLRVEQGRYWSYLCTNPLCCPPAGVPFTTDGHPAAVAMTATSGHQVLASRAELAATIAPVTGATAEAMRRETSRAQRIAAQLIARTAATGSPPGRSSSTASKPSRPPSPPTGTAAPSSCPASSPGCPSRSPTCGSATTPGPAWTPPTATPTCGCGRT